MARELHGSREIVPHEESNQFTMYMNRETECYPSHWHSELEVIMPLENIYTINLEGTTYLLEPQDIMIIPSGISHELIAPATGRRLILLVRHQIVREVNGFDSVYNRFFPCALFRHGENEADHRKMVGLLETAMEEYATRQPLWEASMHGAVIRFFVIAGRIFINRSELRPMVSPRKQRAYTETFFAVCTYINDHCSEKLTLEETAKLAGFSRSQFIRLFKDYTGVSYYEYLTRQRLTRADILLGEPEYSITEIAMHSGFNSLSTFNRVFKSYHHCTPMEYRQHHQRNVPAEMERDKRTTA